jgi:hypothetical protein
LNTYREIELTQGLTAKVNPEDFDKLNAYNWQALWNGRHWYAVRASPGGGLIYMHRAILGAEPGQDVDHRNRKETLDNTRDNLRLASRSQNQANRGLLPTNTLGYTGVRPTPSGKFIGRVTKLGRCYFTKVHATIEAAACARDQLAQELFGEFAVMTSQVAA